MKETDYSVSILMKKLLFIALCLLSVNVSAQGIMDRFRDPKDAKTVFFEKGNRSMGISGSYRSFSAGSDMLGDGYAILSMINIGSGQFSTYMVRPKFAYFIMDDLSLGVSVEYSGYKMKSDLRLDLRTVANLDEITDQALKKELNDLLNLRITGRDMVRNSWGASFNLRKYISFFGSQTFAVFAEARLYGNYGYVNSCPVDVNGALMKNKMRTSGIFSTGLKFAGGLCVRLSGHNSFTISVPLIGVSYSSASQHKEETNNNARLSEFKIARDLDFLAIQVGYQHCIVGKKKK